MGFKFLIVGGEPASGSGPGLPESCRSGLMAMLPGLTPPDSGTWGPPAGHLQLTNRDLVPFGCCERTARTASGQCSGVEFGL